MDDEEHGGGGGFSLSISRKRSGSAPSDLAADSRSEPRAVRSQPISKDEENPRGPRVGMTYSVEIQSQRTQRHSQSQVGMLPSPVVGQGDREDIVDALSFVTSPKDSSGSETSASESSSPKRKRRLSLLPLSFIPRSPSELWSNSEPRRRRSSSTRSPAKSANSTPRHPGRSLVLTKAQEAETVKRVNRQIEEKNKMRVSQSGYEQNHRLV